MIKLTSVRGSVRYSVENSAWYSVRDSVWYSVRYSVMNSICEPTYFHAEIFQIFFYNL